MSNNIRLCRRSMVEVLIKKKDLLGAWHYAEIVEDDGDGYIVRCFHSPGVFKQSTDKVPKEAIRPRAPPVTAGSTNWSVGDVVEVLDDCVWRVSIIEEVLEDGFYYIQVMGSVDEFTVKKSCIRPRQQWIKNQWDRMGKEDSGIDGKLLSRTRKRIDMQRQRELINKREKEVKKSAKLSKKLKRSSKDDLSVDEASLKCVKKQRVVDKEVDRVVVPDSYSCTGQWQQTKQRAAYKPYVCGRSRLFQYVSQTNGFSHEALYKLYLTNEQEIKGKKLEFPRYAY